MATIVLRDDVAIDTSAVGPAQVAGDARTLEQAARNLIQNAVRHARHQVRISVANSPGLAVLAVDDDGPGVPEEHRDDIFERFVRLDDARDREAGGSGLGLAIVREIAQAHGGRVLIEQSDLGGARFVVELPRAD
ncbi:MAG: ATP-binding protein [Aeromicrobium sp.]